jgi:hypothetical protein
MNHPYRGLRTCAHDNITEVPLKGGDGPDESSHACTCIDCGAHRWRYCDQTYSKWSTPPGYS